MGEPEQINLRFCLWNVENLFLLFDGPMPTDVNSLGESEWQRLSTSIFENKPLRKLQEIARTIREINPDILMLCEVGGEESLRNFNSLFLNGDYSCALIEGNSDRHIHVGFLLRKGLPFFYDIISNKNRPINYLYPHERDSLASGYPLKHSSHKFSRDAVELKFFRRDRESPFFVALLTHLKSRLDPDGIDPGGFERRKAELRTLLEIYREAIDRHPQTPTIVCGDFNGNASRTGTDEEFRLLYESSDLEDALELLKVKTEDRATFYNIRPNGRPEGRQIDYCFLPPGLSAHLKQAYIHRFSDHRGMPLDIPQSLDAKLKLPSDHYPYVFDLENLKIW
ncbi:MAG: hypothetical protein N2578_01555 [Bdellovibrionaceae bacterium]|nr:hypothetical protein [Pseudobdellovibrionaceae bacterium]